jgi:flavodoxin
MKSILYYYSLTGKTKLVAETLGKQSGADVREIQETKKQSIFGAYITGSFAALRHKTSSIQPVDLNLKNYDTIFIGSPIWAGNCAPAINTLMEQVNLKNKNVVLFFTMGGNEAKKAVEYLTKVVASQGGKVIDTASFNSSAKSEELIRKAQEFGKSIKNKIRLPIS